MAKKLLINCGSCDARFVSEATLSAYESIAINCGDVLVTPEAKDLLNRYGVTMNCGEVRTLDKDVKVRSVNGSAQILSSDVVTDQVYLVVNGSLEIGPNTAEVLKQYVGIQVNGAVTYPESVSSCLSLMSVNGATTCYPDGAIILKRNAVIDKLFALRAKESLYWAAKRMIMVDPQLDAAALAAKGATFAASQVILAESKVEDMIALIDEKAQIDIVPDGTAVILDDVELSDLTLKKYGTKLYVIGDLQVTEEAADCLEKLEYLNIRGDAKVTEGMKDKLLVAITEISGKVNVVKPPKGRLMADKVNLRLSKWLLEKEPEGIAVRDCVVVTLDEDISCDLILEKLTIADCVQVKCTPEQEAAVVAIATDVQSIGGGKVVKVDDDLVQEVGADPMGIGDMIKSAMGVGKDLLNTKVINAGDYVL